MDVLSRKRFVKALRAAQELLAGEAHCYCYEQAPEYLEMKEDIKFALRMLEEGEAFAGKLLYKNARNLKPSTATRLAQEGRTEEERAFFALVAEMNQQKPRC